MADDNRRIGDWQHKSQRQDANDLMPDSNPKPWHRQTFWIVFFLLIFWPVGIVLCWKSDWHVVAKIIATIFVIFAVYMVWNMQQAVLQMQAQGLLG